MGIIERHSYHARQHDDYPDQQAEVALSSGDVVVLMSDGLPERFNPQNEMFDEAQTKLALAAAAGKSSQEIIDHFVKVGDEWDDDVTFVVVRMR